MPRSSLQYFVHAVLLSAMDYAVATFLAQTAVISLSGVLAPGPVTTATLAAGATRRHAGAWIAIGHGVIEFPLMGLIMLGAGKILQADSFRIGVGLAGGAALLLMAAMMLASLRQPIQEQTTSTQYANPLWTGIVLTIGNPYFLFWWATVGLNLATGARNLGILAFGLFAMVHWLCDLVWLEILSVASNKGVGLLGPASQKVILLVCSLAMAVFGLRFIIDAAGKLWH